MPARNESPLERSASVRISASAILSMTRPGRRQLDGRLDIRLGAALAQHAAQICAALDEDALRRGSSFERRKQALGKIWVYGKSLEVDFIQQTRHVRSLGTKR